jgi:hypothetical protein
VIFWLSEVSTKWATGHVTNLEWENSCGGDIFSKRWTIEQIQSFFCGNREWISKVSPIFAATRQGTWPRIRQANDSLLHLATVSDEVGWQSLKAKSWVNEGDRIKDVHLLDWYCQLKTRRWNEMSRFVNCWRKCWTVRNWRPEDEMSYFYGYLIYLFCLGCWYVWNEQSSIFFPIGGKWSGFIFLTVRIIRTI